MGTLHSNPKNLAMAKRVRKAWKQGEHSTYSALARAFDIEPSQARRIVLGEILKGGANWPEGNWRKYSIHDKQFVIYDDGRVWSVTSNKFVGTTMNGYKVFKVIAPDGKYLNLRVSRVMLEVFERPPKDGEFARHLDDDIDNNDLANLAWGSPADNSQDMVSNYTQAFGERNCKAKLDDELVRAILDEYDGIGFKPFARQFIQNRGLQLRPLAIVRVLRGDSWTHVTFCDVPDSVVRAMHRNWLKVTYPMHVFCVKYARFLNKKGYTDVRPYHVHSALTGKLWRGIFDEFQ